MDVEVPCTEIILEEGRMYVIKVEDVTLLTMMDDGKFVHVSDFADTTIVCLNKKVALPHIRRKSPQSR